MENRAGIAFAGRKPDAHVQHCSTGKENNHQVKHASTPGINPATALRTPFQAVNDRNGTHNTEIRGASNAGKTLTTISTPDLRPGISSASAKEVPGDLEVIEACRTAMASLATACKERLDIAVSLKSKLQPVQAMLARASPTVIGILGDTGAGKSSLLNALLGEATLLPTNSMRACTAAVVELMRSDCDMYNVVITFMTRDAWRKRVLRLWQAMHDEHGTLKLERRDNMLDMRTPQGQAQSSLEAVLGCGVVRSADVSLASLQGAESAVTALLGTQLQYSERDAAACCARISEYVDSHNSTAALQAWPLVELCTVKHNWKVLPDGLVLADLPGVADANIARGSIATGYVDRCTAVWIAADITRAVDNATAKELLHSEVHRQRQVEGHKVDITFICTKTDNMSVQQTIDSLGVDELCRLAETTPGRLQELEAAVTQLQDQQPQAQEQVADLKAKVRQCEVRLRRAKKGEMGRSSQQSADGGASDSDYDGGAASGSQSTPSSAKRSRISGGCRTSFSPGYSNPSPSGDSSEVRKARKGLAQAKAELKQASSQLAKIHSTLAKRQQELATLCALGRNGYAKQRLQEDFREAEDGGQLPVFCVSAREARRREQRSTRDGGAAVFTKLEQTELPALRAHIESSATQHRHHAAGVLADRTSSFITYALCTLRPAGATSCCVSSDPTERRILQTLDTSQLVLQRYLAARAGPASVIAGVASTAPSDSVKPSEAQGTCVSEHTATTMDWSAGAVSVPAPQAVTPFTVLSAQPLSNGNQSQQQFEAHTPALAAAGRAHSLPCRQPVASTSHSITGCLPTPTGRMAAATQLLHHPALAAQILQPQAAMTACSPPLQRSLDMTRDGTARSTNTAFPPGFNLPPGCSSVAKTPLPHAAQPERAASCAAPASTTEPLGRLASQPSVTQPPSTTRVSKLASDILAKIRARDSAAKPADGPSFMGLTPVTPAAPANPLNRLGSLTAFSSTPICRPGQASHAATQSAGGALSATTPAPTFAAVPPFSLTSGATAGLTGTTNTDAAVENFHHSLPFPSPRDLAAEQAMPYAIASTSTVEKRDKQPAGVPPVQKAVPGSADVTRNLHNPAALANQAAASAQPQATSTTNKSGFTTGAVDMMTSTTAAAAQIADIAATPGMHHARQRSPPSQSLMTHMFAKVQNPTSSAKPPSVGPKQVAAVSRQQSAAWLTEHHAFLTAAPAAAVPLAAISTPHTSELHRAFLTTAPTAAVPLDAIVDAPVLPTPVPRGPTPKPGAAPPGNPAPQVAGPEPQAAPDAGPALRSNQVMGLRVVCNKRRGILLHEYGRYRIMLQPGQEVVNPPQFEQLAGRGAAKKWRESVRVDTGSWDRACAGIQVGRILADFEQHATAITPC